MPEEIDWSFFLFSVSRVDLVWLGLGGHLGLGVSLAHALNCLSPPFVFPFTSSSRHVRVKFYSPVYLSFGFITLSLSDSCAVADADASASSEKRVTTLGGAFYDMTSQCLTPLIGVRKGPGLWSDVVQAKRAGDVTGATVRETKSA